MLIAHSIVSYSALFAATAATGVGFAAVWSNPQRRINRVFFTASLHVAAWLTCRYLAVAEGNLQWVRVACAVGALMHFHLWLIKETVAKADERLIYKIIRGRWWLAAGIALACLCFTDWFIPDIDAVGSPSGRRYAIGFYVYLVGMAALFLWLCGETVRQIKLQSGVQRLELQVLMFGGSATALVILILMALRAAIGAPWLRLLDPFVVFGFYTGTVVAITTSRIFDARQIFFVASQKTLFLGTIVCVIYLGDAVLSPLLSNLVIATLVIGIAIALGSVANSWLAHQFQFFSGSQAARQAAYLAAQQERRSDNLTTAFVNILKGWGQTECALIATRAKSAALSSVDDEASVFQTMRSLRWATPERLVRERRTAQRDVVAAYLSQKQLGLLVFEEGTALSVLVGVGLGASRRPFTYPQVFQLTELASIMSSALERAHFSAKVQHTEQLATVGLLGASLAHEIRNPLVSIKTFVQLLPSHHGDPAFRQKFFKLIGDEVGRIDQLTDQLLDLAAPRAYLSENVELHSLIKASLDLVAAKAAHRNVDLITDFKANPDNAYTDASAAKQVMLNLCFNAIQAIDGATTAERWVRVATKNVGAGIEIAVADSGPGIAPEIRPRLFQPFQTTKSNGFGLGLAICSDILANLDARITVDAPETGRGATFRIIFPCRPQSS